MPPSERAVLFVSYHFAPENVSGTHRPLHFARALEDAGYRVWVVAASARAVTHTDPALLATFPWSERIARVEAQAATLGALYRSLRRGRTTATPLGRTPGAPGREGAAPHDRPRRFAGLRRHLVARELLPDAQRSWFAPAVRAALRIGRREAVAAVYASGPPWTAVRVGHRVARRLGLPFIADFRDPWTELTGATWRYATAWAHRRARRWEEAVLRDARVALFNSPRAAVAARAAADPAKIQVILNGSDVPRRTAAGAFPATPPLRIRHFGTLYAGRSIDALLAALAQPGTGDGPRPQDCEIELVGQLELGPEETAALAGGPVPVRTVAPLPFAEAAARMSEPAVLLVVQPEHLATQIPTKLFDYLATGNPVLVMTPAGSATWEVARGFARCRRLDPGPSEENRQVVAQLWRDWRAGRLRMEASEADTRGFTKAGVRAAFVRLMEETLGGSPA